MSYNIYDEVHRDAIEDHRANGFDPEIDSDDNEPHWCRPLSNPDEKNPFDD